MNIVVPVNATRAYDVTIGSALSERLAESLPHAATRVLIVHSAPLAMRAENLRSVIEATGRQVVMAEVPDAEAAKTAEVLAFCWQVLGKSNFSRTDAVVGLGGGAVTDLAGFVAATWLRGIAVVQAPTSLLAMVDAAVGGKTGINTAEGKNLVGAFHEPVAVWCDVDHLVALPRHDLVAGLAEVVKAGFIRDPEILDIVERNVSLLTAATPHDDLRGASGSDVRPLDPEALPVLIDLMGRAIRVKAAVVSTDLHEADLREILNYGHTFGHAIELTERYRWRHGAAVSVGMVFAAELSRLSGRLSEADVERHRTVLSSLGLPTTYVAGRWEALLAAMRRDKKTRGELLRFVILQGMGNPVRLEGPDPALLTAAYAAVTR